MKEHCSFDAFLATSVQICFTCTHAHTLALFLVLAFPDASEAGRCSDKILENYTRTSLLLFLLLHRANVSMSVEIASDRLRDMGRDVKKPGVIQVLT